MNPKTISATIEIGQVSQEDTGNTIKVKLIASKQEAMNKLSEFKNGQPNRIYIKFDTKDGRLEPL